MDPTHIPGLLDASKHIEDSTTKTANYNGATLDLGDGFSAGGMGEPMAAVVEVSALDHTTGDETYSFALYESDDNATFTVCGPVVPVAAVGNYAIPGWVSKRYIRATLAAAGTTPSITYATDFTVTND